MSRLKTVRQFVHVAVELQGVPLIAKESILKLLQRGQIKLYEKLFDKHFLFEKKVLHTSPSDKKYGLTLPTNRKSETSNTNI